MNKVDKRVEKRGGLSDGHEALTYAEAPEPVPFSFKTREMEMKVLAIIIIVMSWRVMGAVRHIVHPEKRIAIGKHLFMRGGGRHFIALFPGGHFQVTAFGSGQDQRRGK